MWKTIQKSKIDNLLNKSFLVTHSLYLQLHRTRPRTGAFLWIVFNSKWNHCTLSYSIWFQAGGIEILADILSSRNRPERELTDAVSVLAQITSPWIEDNRAVNGLREYLDTIVSSLTGTCIYFRFFCSCTNRCTQHTVPINRR